MLDKDNIISTIVSEADEKIPKDAKEYRKCSFMCFTLHSHSIQRAYQHLAIANAQKKLSIKMHPVQLKKSTEDILNKIYTEKGTVTGIWLVLSTVEVRKEFTGFQSGNKLADDARKEVASYMGAQ